MSALAKAVLAFAERNAFTDEDAWTLVDRPTWLKWLEFARVDGKRLAELEDRERRSDARTEARLGHGAACLCTTCRLRREASLLPAQPSEAPRSPQREPERAAEGAAHSAGERSQGAADPTSRLEQEFSSGLLVPLAPSRLTPLERLSAVHAAVDKHFKNGGSR